jgi:hypothetical protein
MHRFLKIVPRTARAGRFPPNRVAALAFLVRLAGLRCARFDLTVRNVPRGITTCTEVEC